NAALTGIEYASSAIMVSAHRLQDMRHPADAFGLVIPACENRRILAVSFGSRKFTGRAPEGHVLLRTFIGGAMQPELMKHSDDELQQIADEELNDILGVSGTPLFRHLARYENSMPQYHVGHVQRVAEIQRLAAQHSGLQLAGSAYEGVGIPDSIASARKAADLLLKADMK
ncbi:MAG: protoporphyrinogen oxidase, partial [Planctomycetaceae bacterium]|nr:protoporphyrinogen oxidase [Planctomycetaceae bacterium]